MRYLYLENTQPGHNKFYEMTESGSLNSFTSRWGKIGSTGTTKEYPIDQWYVTRDNKLNKGYVDVSHKGTPPQPTIHVNGAHLQKVDKLILLLHANVAEIVGGTELIRDVSAIRKGLRDVKSSYKGNLDAADMRYLNDVWKKVRQYAKKT